MYVAADPKKIFWFECFYLSLQVGQYSTLEISPVANDGLRRVGASIDRCEALYRLSTPVKNPCDSCVGSSLVGYTL